MPKFVELAIDGVIHESEIFGAAMPPDKPKDKAQGEDDKSEDDATTTGSGSLK